MSQLKTSLVVLAAGFSAIALTNAQQDRVGDYVRAQLRWHMIPGVALGVMEHGRLIRGEGYGVTHHDRRDSVRVSTLFHLGSVGKQFTSAAVLLLAQDGRLRLDDDVTMRLRFAPAAWRGVTLRHLLTHTSGMGDYDNVIPDLSRESALRAESWPVAPPSRIDGATLDRYAGEFRLGDAAIRVWREADGLLLTGTGRGSARLIPLSPTRFVIEAGGLEVRFAPAGAVRPDLYVREGGAERRTIRVSPAAGGRSKGDFRELT